MKHSLWTLWRRYRIVGEKTRRLKALSPLAHSVAQVWKTASEQDRQRLLAGGDPRTRLFLRREIKSPAELKHLLETVPLPPPDPDGIGLPVQAITELYLTEARQLLAFEWQQRSPALQEALAQLRQALDAYEAGASG